MKLVEISPESHDVVLDIRYATADNFTGQPIYRRAACYLLAEAAEALQRAVALARPLGYRFKVFDAFRPSEAQWLMWTHTPDPEFLADPRRGSPHSRGAAIDLTLIDHAGAELPMGTAFDALTPLSHHGVTQIAAADQHNRALLLGLMTAAGWDFYRNEWWHYQLFDARRYPVLEDGDLPLPMMGA